MTSVSVTILLLVRISEVSRVRVIDSNRKYQPVAPAVSPIVL